EAPQHGHHTRRLHPRRLGRPRPTRPLAPLRRVPRPTGLQAFGGARAAGAATDGPAAPEGRHGGRRAESSGEEAVTLADVRWCYDADQELAHLIPNEVSGISDPEGARTFCGRPIDWLRPVPDNAHLCSLCASVKGGGALYGAVSA